MKFFTDEKFANDTSHSEYEEYCRDKWESIPDDLKSINKGMLPEEMLEGLEGIDLHDARIVSLNESTGSITIELEADNDGGLRKVSLKYVEGVVAKKPNENVLGSNIEDRDSDIMCHEIGITNGTGFTHTLLFASEEELQINFHELVVKFEDVA